MPFISHEGNFKKKPWKYLDLYHIPYNTASTDFYTLFKYFFQKLDNAVVTPLHKAASYEPRIAIFGIWGDTWLTRGKYGIYVEVHGSYGVYVPPPAT